MTRKPVNKKVTAEESFYKKLPMLTFYQEGKDGPRKWFSLGLRKLRAIVYLHDSIKEWVTKWDDKSREEYKRNT